MDKFFREFRFKVQVFWTFLTNGYVTGFLKRKIYQGKFKNVCVPGLNCYSCIGAFGACPIGALQSTLGRSGKKSAFYVIGFLMVVGGLIGRFVCGWLCPFGLFQDLLHKIPFVKKIRYMPGEKFLKYFKYVILIVFVIVLPMFLVNDYGQGAPHFCKWICPQGTLEGGIPLVLLNPALRKIIGKLYLWKNIILIVTILLSVIIYRPFCKIICPLGAIYSFFNKVSLYRYSVNKSKCISCGKCRKICEMNVDPVIESNALECIRCAKCRHACPVKAIEHSFGNIKL